MPSKTVPPAEPNPTPIKVPRLINVAEVKATPREGTLIHFTEEQWKAAIREIPTGKALPKVGTRLTFYPLPDGGGVIGGDCIQMPCELCRVRQVFDPKGGQLIFDCQCRPDPRCPEDPPPPPPPPTSLCRLVIQVGSRPLISCQSNGCQQRCRLTGVRQGGRWIITCACRR